MGNRANAIVVGAGISGLACAYRLQQKGYAVTIIESADRIGGVMQTRIQDGFLCEAGPNSFQNSPEIMDLITELGLDSELLTAESRLPRLIFHNGRLQRAPMGPGALISTRLLSGRGKLRLLREPWVPRRMDGIEETLAQFISRRFGDEVLHTFVAPFVSGIYAGDPSLLSAQSTFPMLTELEAKYGSVLKGFIKSAKSAPKPRRPRLLCSFRDGMQALPRALAAKIGHQNILLQSDIESLSNAGANGSARFNLAVSTPSGARALSAPILVLAPTAYRAAKLLAALAPSISRELAAIPYPSLTGICISYRKEEVPQPLHGFGFLVPRDQGVRLLGCIWSSSLFPGRAPANQGLLTLFIGGATDPEASELKDDPLIEVVRKDLKITMGITAAPRVQAIHRYERAIPQYTLGHAARLQRIAVEAKRFPGLFFAGNFLQGVSAGDCIKQANDVACSISGSGMTLGH